ncbi:MAG: hypothetical protein GF313_02075 [Caldithrix sp.]|nr:hypothetical protein [Caldithrix sp.]
MKFYKRIITLTITLFWAYLIIACGNKMPLPSVEANPESFGANDTSYIHINPDWDAATLGYTSENPFTPVDIKIGPDDYIFVADSANNRIVTLFMSGFVAQQNNLNSIEPIERPSGLAINETLNLLIVNGTNKVFAWNQYLNTVDIESVLLGEEDDGTRTDDPTVIDSLLKVYTLFEDDSLTDASFNSIAYGSADDNSIYVTYKKYNRILELELQQSALAELTNGRTHPIFTAKWKRDVATEGTGAGTVDNPKGMTTDANGNIYFTQLGGNFLVQKLEHSGSSFSPGYTLYEDPIMDLNRFKGPFDIALGENDAIFVLDTADSGKVTKYHNKGLMAGTKADLGNIGLSQARFPGARSIAISSEEVVYIANTRLNRIDRYQYTVSEEELPDDEQR